MSHPRHAPFPQPGPLIGPSMLKCDFGDLNGEIARLVAGGAKMLHWDVMDGRFVPNLSYGAMVIQSTRSKCDLFFDAHLMIADPAKYLGDFVKAGCDAITIHVEAVPDPRAVLRDIRARGCLAGLALNPGTPVEAVRPHVAECDLVLVMSVEPGFGGQAFKPETLEKARELKPLLAPGARLSIDGGIGPGTIELAARAGVDFFVAGSSIFDRPDYGAAIADLLRRTEQPA